MLKIFAYIQIYERDGRCDMKALTGDLQSQALIQFFFLQKNTGRMLQFFFLFITLEECFF